MKRLAYLLTLALPDSEPEHLLPILTLLVIHLQIICLIVKQVVNNRSSTRQPRAPFQRKPNQPALL